MPKSSKSKSSSATSTSKRSTDTSSSAPSSRSDISSQESIPAQYISLKSSHWIGGINIDCNGDTRTCQGCVWKAEQKRGKQRHKQDKAVKQQKITAAKQKLKLAEKQVKADLKKAGDNRLRHMDENRREVICKGKKICLFCKRHEVDLYNLPSSEDEDSEGSESEVSVEDLEDDDQKP